jgi:hypothetical protein
LFYTGQFLLKGLTDCGVLFEHLPDFSGRVLLLLLLLLRLRLWL